MAEGDGGKAKSETIAVVIRIRPMNGKEQMRGERIAVEYDEERSEIGIRATDGKLTNPWTFDGIFGIDTEQGNMYNKVARNMVDTTFDGFNATIFAYGQTGSGKTFSMDGTREYPGIIPRAIQHIFDKIAQITAEAGDQQVFLVRVSYLEVYNEQVHDLLGKETSAEANVLPIKEDAKEHRFFAKDLTERVVDNKHDVEDMIAEGNRRRSVAKTDMNAESSRSHAIFTCMVERQRITSPEVAAAAAAFGDATPEPPPATVAAPAAADFKGKKGGKAAPVKEAGPAAAGMASGPLDKKAGSITVGKLNLVDLAGSERGAKTGATGSTAKEGSYINKSLSALGDVIKALEIRALDTKQTKVHIPYRNSALTKLLSDSLGGNSRTLMIAACGPAGSNTEETISTLRFAARVKAVKNKPKVNEDPKDAKLRELAEEIARLKAEAAKGGGGGGGGGGGSGGVDSARLAEAHVHSVVGKIMYKVAMKRLEKKEVAAVAALSTMEREKDSELEQLRAKVASTQAEKDAVELRAQELIAQKAADYERKMAEALAGGGGGAGVSAGLMDAKAQAAAEEARLKAEAEAAKARAAESAKFEAALKEAKAKGNQSLQMSLEEAEASRKAAASFEARALKAEARNKELEQRLNEADARADGAVAMMVKRIKAMEESVSSTESDLEARTDELERLRAERGEDEATFKAIKDSAMEQLGHAQARIEVLTKDLNAAWEQSGQLEARMKGASGGRLLTAMLDRRDGIRLRKALKHWASSKIAGYAPKAFPEQLGPFGLMATSLTKNMQLNLQPAVGIYTYQVPMVGPLADISKRFGDSVMDIGQLSPPHALTLSHQARRFAGIPDTATTVMWAYPLVGMAETSQKFELDLSDSALLFTTFGGFVYCDSEDDVVHTCAIGAGEDLFFDPSKPWRPNFTEKLAQAGRFQAITISALSDVGALYYCWVHAGERLSGAVGNEEWMVAEHGAFVYLFNEPDDKHSDPRNVFFPVWGGKGRGSGSDSLGGATDFVKKFASGADAVGHRFDDEYAPPTAAAKARRRMTVRGKAPLPPPPPQPSRGPSATIITRLKSIDDEFSSDIERMAFDDGPMGVGIKYRAGCGLMVVNVARGGQACVQGLTIGCVIVELMGEHVAEDIDERTFLAHMSGLERPILLGYRRPKPQGQSEADDELASAVVAAQALHSQMEAERQEKMVVARFDAGSLGMSLSVTGRGLEVTSVDPKGQAARGGVAKGAVIAEVEGEELPSVPKEKLQAAFISRFASLPRPVHIGFELPQKGGGGGGTSPPRATGSGGGGAVPKRATMAPGVRPPPPAVARSASAASKSAGTARSVNFGTASPRAPSGPLFGAGTAAKHSGARIKL